MFLRVIKRIDTLNFANFTFDYLMQAYAERSGADQRPPVLPSNIWPPQWMLPDTSVPLRLCLPLNIRCTSLTWAMVAIGSPQMESRHDPSAVHDPKRKFAPIAPFFRVWTTRNDWEQKFREKYEDATINQFDTDFFVGAVHQPPTPGLSSDFSIRLCKTTRGFMLGNNGESICGRQLRRPMSVSVLAVDPAFSLVLLLIV